MGVLVQRMVPEKKQPKEFDETHQEDTSRTGTSSKGSQCAGFRQRAMDLVAVRWGRLSWPVGRDLESVPLK